MDTVQTSVHVVFYFKNQLFMSNQAKRLFYIKHKISTHTHTFYVQFPHIVYTITCICPYDIVEVFLELDSSSFMFYCN